MRSASARCYYLLDPRSPTRRRGTFRSSSPRARTNDMKADSNDLIVVCGAGGFIGGHLVSDFLRQGYRRIRAVDIKPFDEWYQRFDAVENHRLDLRGKDDCTAAVEGAQIVYNLAADMGGMGFIENNRA